MLLFFWQNNNLGVLYSAEIRGAVMRFQAQRQDSWAEYIQHSNVEKVLWNNCCSSVYIVYKPNTSMTRVLGRSQASSNWDFPSFTVPPLSTFWFLLVLFMSHRDLCMTYLSAVVTGAYFMNYFPCNMQFSVCRNMGSQLKPAVIWTNLFPLYAHKMHLIAL